MIAKSDKVQVKIADDKAQKAKHMVGREIITTQYFSIADEPAPDRALAAEVHACEV